MQKKKNSLWWYMLGAVFAVYIGYLAGGACADGYTVFEWYEKFEVICSRPLGMYFTEYTPKAILSALFLYGMVVLVYITSRRNYMPGKEFGTAALCPPCRANKMLMDADDRRNRILSAGLKMSMDFRRLKLNGNILICGGSGAGKTFFVVKPNLMQMPEKNSFVITDPKGEILRSCGQMLKESGYKVKVVNLVEPDKSDHYNPFRYLREDTDVIKLITNLIANTTPKGATSSDPFWEKAEGLLLQSIFYYIWKVMPPREQNFQSVLKLLGEAEVSDDEGSVSPLTERMEALKNDPDNKLGAEHPAVKQYYKCMRGAGDTVRSIIISANSRLAFLENGKILELLSNDDMNLECLGLGHGCDGHTRTALFCVIPDSDKSYNFIIGMLYTQIFQELYYQADFNCGGRLPLHVTFMLDEFANVALPDDFCSLLSTMRSREISSIIIIQNFAQLKALFKDTWETIPGNCDTFVYLGGNEQSTHKYVSELLGKGTIDKKSSGETMGRQGSSSRNYDVLGRELMMPDEVRKLDNKNCIIFIRGLDPILDAKYVPFGHPNFKFTEDGGGKAYIHSRNTADDNEGFSVMSEEAFKLFMSGQEDKENIKIVELSVSDALHIPSGGLERELVMSPDEETARDMDRIYSEKYGGLELSEESLSEEGLPQPPYEYFDAETTVMDRLAEKDRFSEDAYEFITKTLSDSAYMKYIRRNGVFLHEFVQPGLSVVDLKLMLSQLMEENEIVEFSD